MSIIKNREEKIKVSMDELVRAAVNKYRVQYIIAGCFIAVAELYMLIRGAIYFDMTQWRRPIYMICYAVLLLATILCLFVIFRNGKGRRASIHEVRTVYFYSIILLVWSAAISFLDAFGGHPPIVYMTVLVGVAALSCIRPLVFYFVTTPLTIAMCIGLFNSDDHLLGGSGFITNLIVFVVISGFIVSRQFVQNRRDYIAMKNLENMSFHDQLTGAKNRQALHVELNDLGEVFYFGLLDFDNFKKINDENGHDFGDQALCKGTELLQKHFGEGVYRFGGDEFIVITDMRGADIEEAGREINKEFEEAFPGKDVHMTGGFYCPKSKKENYDDYLKQADEVLYAAKELGKRRFVAKS